jgi:cytochrome c-type biogenesis protein CcmH/NrfG
VREEDALCPTCGEPLTPGPAEEIVSPPSQPMPTAPQPVAQAGGSPTRTYLIGGIAALAIAGIVFLLAAPDWYSVGAPGPMPPATQGGAGQPGADGAMPQGHPPVNQQVPPELEKQIADQEKIVTASPANLDEKLKLANLYFDAGRHAQALPLYREYVAAHPDNDDARTDMANSIANTGNIPEAMTELRQVIEHNPKHQNAAFNLSMMYVSQRNRDSAVYWMERVYAIDSTTHQGKTAAEILQGLKNPPAKAPANPPATSAQ